MKSARAVAHANIALVKYWGKRPPAPGQAADLNLPAVGSLSLTLEDLRTETVVRPATRDEFVLDGHPARDDQAAKVWRHLDRLWRTRTVQGGSGKASERPPCHIDSRNELPTAAGLASSASGFAALTLAAVAAFDLDGDRSTWSSWARQGSGSAARSLWGGFVRLDAGVRADGADCRAYPLFPAEHWPALRLVVVETTRGEKPMGSTEAMEHSRLSSPYYGPWVETATRDLDEAERAIATRELGPLGRVVEHSCFKMHAAAMAADPPILYWNGTTVAVIQELWRQRQAGLEGYVTMDAGPHVKVVSTEPVAAELAARLGRIPGVVGVRVLGGGPDARVEVMP